MSYTITNDMVPCSVCGRSDVRAITGRRMRGFPAVHNCPHGQRCSGGGPAAACADCAARREAAPTQVGRRVRILWPEGEGVIARWTPLARTMCDALVRRTDGRECFYSSRDLRPIDGLGPLPSRAEFRARNDAEGLASLRRILRDHVAKHLSGEHWQGCDFGRAQVGNMILEAIKSYGGDPRAELAAALEV